MDLGLPHHCGRGGLVLLLEVATAEIEARVGASSGSAPELTDQGNRTKLNHEASDLVGGGGGMHPPPGRIPLGARGRQSRVT
jgi:hypothetical protein